MYHLTEELEWAWKHAGDKAWNLIMKICSLEVKLHEAREKIGQFEKGSAWAQSKEEYSWVWSKKFFDLQK